MENLGDIIRRVAEKFNCTEEEAGEKIMNLMQEKKITTFREAAAELLSLTTEKLEK